MKNKVKREALQEYEATMRKAAKTRKEALEAARNIYKATQGKAKNIYNQKVVDAI